MRGGGVPTPPPLAAKPLSVLLLAADQLYGNTGRALEDSRIDHLGN